MSITGHTPIGNVEGIPEAVKSRLHTLWVTSLEEYVALLAALGSVEHFARATGVKLRDVETSRLSFSSLPQSRISLLQTPQKGGTLGCQVDLGLIEAFTMHSTLLSSSMAAPQAFAGKLPSSVRLMENLGPVKHQGERGTCVAFASVGLREFLAKDGVSLSEQFLYWACKELDGSSDAGTYVRTAMTALASYGTCTSAKWPYNPVQSKNEGQGPPTDGAVEEAASYKMAHTRTVEPNLVQQYKHILAGGGDAKQSMPVVLATLVFNSWYMSAETHRTGKITMPLPGERPLEGGHAWCVVGYVDDESVPGGGYFILRNSWGKDWAVDSPEAGGHALMPYEYVTRCGIEAFTGQRVAMEETRERKDDGEFAGYVRRLSEPARDLDDRLLPKESAVLCNPLAPEKFYKDTPENRQAFKRRNFTWTDNVRQDVWFKDTKSFSSELNKRLEAIRVVRKRFVTAVHENILSSKGSPFPYLRLPFWVNLIPWNKELRITAAKEEADLTESLLQIIKEQSGTPSGLEWPEEWAALLRGLNDLKVYAVQRGSKRIHVLSAFITKLSVGSQAEPRIDAPDQTALDAVHSLYTKWNTSNGKHRPLFCFITVGSIECPNDKVSAQAAGDHWLMFSYPIETGRWNTILPKRFGDRLATRDFMDRLKPETQLERVSRVKDCVDEMILDGGNITVEKVKERTGYRKSTIRQAFLTIQERAGDNYRIYKTSNDGQIAIEKANANKKITLTSAYFRRNRLKD